MKIRDIYFQTLKDIQAASWKDVCIAAFLDAFGQSFSIQDKQTIKLFPPAAYLSMSTTFLHGSLIDSLDEQSIYREFLKAHPTFEQMVLDKQFHSLFLGKSTEEPFSIYSVAILVWNLFVCFPFEYILRLLDYLVEKCLSECLSYLNEGLLGEKKTAPASSLHLLALENLESPKLEMNAPTLINNLSVVVKSPKKSNSWERQFILCLPIFMLTLCHVLLKSLVTLSRFLTSPLNVWKEVEQISSKPIKYMAHFMSFLMIIGIFLAVWVLGSVWWVSFTSYIDNKMLSMSHGFIMNVIVCSIGLLLGLVSVLFKKWGILKEKFYMRSSFRTSTSEQNSKVPYRKKHISEMGRYKR